MPVRRKSLVAAVASGDRRQALEALRDKLAAECQTSEGRDVAPLAKQLADVIRELAALPTGREESRVDDLARRRASRRSASSERAGGGDVGGAGGG